MYDGTIPFPGGADGAAARWIRAARALQILLFRVHPDLDGVMFFAKPSEVANPFRAVLGKPRSWLRAHIPLRRPRRPSLRRSPMASIRIEWLTDTCDCEDCGMSWAQGARVFLDEAEILHLEAAAACYDGESHDPEEVLTVLLRRLGHSVEVRETVASDGQGGSYDTEILMVDGDFLREADDYGRSEDGVAKVLVRLGHEVEADHVETGSLVDDWDD